MKKWSRPEENDREKDSAGVDQSGFRYDLTNFSEIYKSKNDPKIIIFGSKSIYLLKFYEIYFLLKFQ